jgi:HSP20 family protein
MARNLVRWDPFNEFSTLSREMDRLFGRSFDWRFARDERYVRLPIDAYTTEDELVITAAVPGVSPDDVEVTFEGDVLTIKGDLPSPLGNVDYVAQERPYGSFLRTINVGVPVQADKIEATFDRGLLNITLPKVEEAKPKTIAVKVK